MCMPPFVSGGLVVICGIVSAVFMHSSYSGSTQSGHQKSAIKTEPPLVFEADYTSANNIVTSSKRDVISSNQDITSSKQVANCCDSLNDGHISQVRNLKGGQFLDVQTKSVSVSRRAISLASLSSQLSSKFVSPTSHNISGIKYSQLSLSSVERKKFDPWAYVKFILKPNLLVLSMLGVLVAAQMIFFDVCLPLYLEKMFDLDAIQIGLVFLTFSVSNVGMVPVYGIAVDR